MTQAVDLGQLAKVLTSGRAARHRTFAPDSPVGLPGQLGRGEPADP